MRAAVSSNDASGVCAWNSMRGLKSSDAVAPCFRAPSVPLPEIVIPSASVSRTPLSRVPSAPCWSFGLRVSGAVAPSAPVTDEPASPNKVEGNYLAKAILGKGGMSPPSKFLSRAFDGGRPRARPRTVLSCRCRALGPVSAQLAAAFVPSS
ncbi:hypothetical protein BN77_2937 [Rhizobium mesoamericanum STM3625]|uniref:Uncharacterized protein n=1 Tax=Rhizobium mesoamericanum STM3625 TaxID=1211777 RepID=K0PH05_9HYPH|nr:hypothetical protein BN77_2937 [Rhizobium mesoamericanum STM3625]